MDRPIIFSAPMVRALLDGRKTQTRRIIKPRGRNSLFDGSWDDGYVLDPGNQAWRDQEVLFRAGDRLYVREAFMLVGGGDPGNPIYRANWREDATARHMQNLPAEEPKGWRPSIHMPRWASRLTLVVTEVRVERLQDITNEDCIAEGIPVHPNPNAPRVGPVRNDFARRHGLISYYGGEFRRLWNSINGADAWAANPWVAAVSFTVHRANIDALDIGAAA